LIQGSTKGRQFINQEGQYKYKNIITIVLKLNSELTWVNVRIKIAIVIILKSYSRDNARKSSGHSSRWSTQLTLLFLKIIESTLFFKKIKRFFDNILSCADPGFWQGSVESIVPLFVFQTWTSASLKSSYHVSHNFITRIIIILLISMLKYKPK
jgi:Holliday junction resolvase RusA-like endonuclease